MITMSLELATKILEHLENQWNELPLGNKELEDTIETLKTIIEHGQ